MAVVAMGSVTKHRAGGSVTVADLPRVCGIDDRPGQQSEAPVTRSLIGISELDSRIQEQIAEYGSIKSFQIVLWRDAPDATGCNWNARIDRLRGDSSSDASWWSVVPQMRERFNLM